MELQEESYFIEISLTAVLRKAVELEEALRTCRTKADTKDKR